MSLAHTQHFRHLQVRRKHLAVKKIPYVAGPISVTIFSPQSWLVYVQSCLVSYTQIPPSHISPFNPGIHCWTLGIRNVHLPLQRCDQMSLSMKFVDKHFYETECEKSDQKARTDIYGNKPVAKCQRLVVNTYLSESCEPERASLVSLYVANAEEELRGRLPPPLRVSSSCRDCRMAVFLSILAPKCSRPDSRSQALK